MTLECVYTPPPPNPSFHTLTQLGDYVTALHPDYTYSYAPGQIASIAADGLHFTVDLYDGSQTVLPRQEVYRLPESKHTSDVQYLKRKEQEWVGVACIARKDSDGLYYPGESGIIGYVRKSHFTQELNYQYKYLISIGKSLKFV